VRQFVHAASERGEEVAVSLRDSAPTNEHIVRLLEAVRADLAQSTKRQEEIARNLERLLKQKTA
jgi:hypothetical protein